MVDRYLHMGCCCAMGFVLMVSYRLFHQPLWFSVIVCVLVPSLMGFVKEWDDSREPGNRWDWGDIRDNEIGVSVGVAIGCLLWLL